MAILETEVLVVGAGPVGLLTALQLARLGIRCVILERNETTTKYPKMEYANMRSMELLHKMGLADKLRKVGVPSHFDMTVIFTTGLGDQGDEITRWSLPSPDQLAQRSQEKNDGSGHSQSPLRCSQVLVEALLKDEAERESRIDLRFNTKFEELHEQGDHVMSSFRTTTGEAFNIRSQFVVGCDGAGSRVRKSVNIGLTGGPVPNAFYFVHFKSNDARLQRYGRSWHWFFTKFGFLIAQDEVETYTVHTAVDPDVNVSMLDPIATVHEAIGGSIGPCRIEIDTVLVTGIWRPAMYLADRYQTATGRVFLAGDSAHQVIPVGGFGLNTGIVDAFDIGWKLAYALRGLAGPCLLKSYETERRPVAAQKLEYSGQLFQTHLEWVGWIAGSKDAITSQDQKGQMLRDRVRKHLDTNVAENTSYGSETDYRYNGSHLVTVDEEVAEPKFDNLQVTGSTWPGARAPHVVLSDKTAGIHQLLGRELEFTLFDFSAEGVHGTTFGDKAAEFNIPFKVAHLPLEKEARKIYERDAVLVRPDDHIAWRCNVAGDTCSDVGGVLLRAIGMDSGTSVRVKVVEKRTKEGQYTSSVGDVDYDQLDGKAAWQ